MAGFIEVEIGSADLITIEIYQLTWLCTSGLKTSLSWTAIAFNYGLRLAYWLRAGLVTREIAL